MQRAHGQKDRLEGMESVVKGRTGLASFEEMNTS